MNVSTTFYSSQNSSCWDISLKNTNINLRIRTKQSEVWRTAGGAGCCQKERKDGLTRGWMSGLSQFQTVAWCGVGVMIARRKHRALNGITQGDVNLRRAGGELNMVWGLQWEGWRTESGRQCHREKAPQKLHYRAVHYHFCSSTSLFLRLTQIIFSVFNARNWTRETHSHVRPS